MDILRLYLLFIPAFALIALWKLATQAWGDVVNQIVAVIAGFGVLYWVVWAGYPRASPTRRGNIGADEDDLPTP